MPKITTGDNTVRIAGYAKGRDGIYDQYRFNLINLDGYTQSFAYNVPAGSFAPPRIVRDLLELRKKKLWFTVYLKEKARMLVIVTIKEPKSHQSELWEMAKPVIY
jgi:hypothetical protein